MSLAPFGDIHENGNAKVKVKVNAYVLVLSRRDGLAG